MTVVPGVTKGGYQVDIRLENIGIIKAATIQADGLTVITGKNNSGKTTVGKVAYSIVKANCNVQESFDSSKETYLNTQLDKLRKILLPANSSFSSRTLLPGMSETDNNEESLIKLLNRHYHFNLFQENYQLLNHIHHCLDSLKADDILVFLKNNHDTDGLHPIQINRYKEQFEEIKESAKELCKLTTGVLENKDSYRLYLHQRTKDFLNYYFHKQVKPVRNQDSISTIEITQKGHKCIDIRIMAGNEYYFDMESSFVFPAEQAVFLDDPFILDRIDNDGLKMITKPFDSFNAKDDFIHPTDLQPDEEEMMNMLLSKRSSNFFDEMELQKKYSAIFEKINEIVPGEFLSTNEGLFYSDEHVKLNIHNLATGSKLYFVIKQLLLNGYLDHTLLVLDEPESHLHPEWIQKFAEIIVLLVKELQVKIILTTHSPDLLLALNVFSKDYQIYNRSHFYLAKTINGSWETTIDCIDNDINEGYAHLSVPLLKMSIRNQHQMKEQ